MPIQWVQRVDWRRVGIPLAFFALCVIFAVSSNKFLTIRNLTNVARQISILAFLSYGMTFVIISGGIDISVGSAVSLISMVTGGMMVSLGNIPFGIMMGILCGAFIGVMNGLLVSLFQLPPFIVTMGTGTICAGLALLYANGMPIVGLPQGFGVIGSGYLGPIPIPVIIAFSFFLVSAFIMRYTAYGRHVLAIGGNEEAARLSGINTKWIKLIAYTLTGFLTGIGAVVLSSRIISGYPNLGLGMELQAIAAVVIGGGTLGGGYGTMTGTLFGVLMIGIIQNGLNIMGVSSFVQMIVIGIIIIASVTYDVYRKKRLAE
jgi:ribose/xylose/arabinose/galactoside ABC-type transport system permease subunit